MTTTAIAAVPTMDGGAFDADWLLQPQGEARRLEAALQEPLEVQCPACLAHPGDPCTEALGADCDVCGARAGALCMDNDEVTTEAHAGRGELDGSRGYRFHGERGNRNPHYRQYIGYHVAGKLAGVDDPHGVYMQRQAEFEAELAEAQ